MSDQQNNHREVSASELLQRLDQELHADKRDKTASSVSSDAAKNVTKPAKETPKSSSEGFPSNPSKIESHAATPNEAPTEKKNDELEDLIRKYLYHGDAKAAAAAPQNKLEHVDVEQALDEILEDSGTTSKESVLSHDTPKEQDDTPAPHRPATQTDDAQNAIKETQAQAESGAPSKQKADEIKHVNTVFEGEKVAGALNEEIPLYPEFEVAQQSGEKGVGDDFSTPFAVKGGEAIRPQHHTVAQAIPSMELSDVPQETQEENLRQAKKKAEEAAAQAQETEEEAQLRQFLALYRKAGKDTDTANESETGNGVGTSDTPTDQTETKTQSKQLPLNENGEVDIDAIPENWADLEESEEPLVGPDLNGDGVFDQTDLDLMAAFGVEESLKEAISDKQIDALKTELEQRNQRHLDEMQEGRTRNEFLLQKRPEYVSPAQNKSIFAKYKVKYLRVLRKLGLGLLFTILLFLVENHQLLHLPLPAFMNPDAYQVVYALMDYQLLLLCVATVWNSTWFSFRSMLHRKPMPESVTGVMFILATIYTAAICFLAPIPGNLYLFNFPVAFCALLHHFYRYMRIRREIMSFKIVSSKKPKYVIDALSAQDASLEMECFADYIPNDPLMFKIRRASFVKGFYERMDTYPRSYRILGILIPLSLFIAVAFFFAVFFTAHELYTAVNTAFLALFLCMPVASYISLAHPLYQGARVSYRRESAVIGESSLGEYANASIISFDDHDVFPADKVTVKNVKLYGNNRIDHALYQVAGVFRMLGGPLADIFVMASREVGYSKDVQIRLIDDTGIEALVDGKTVIIGKADFLARYGYAIEQSEEETQMEFSHQAAVMYLAYNDELAAKMYIEYNTDTGFETILRQLYRQGMCVAIKTYDPNIDDALLASKIDIANYPVKIIKCHREEPQNNEKEDKISTGIVSKSSAKNLLRTISLCDRISGALRFNTVLKLITLIVSTILVLCAVLLHFSLELPSFWAVLYQIIWMIPMLLLDRIRIR